MHLLSPKEAQDALAADDGRRRGRRRVPADRRPGEPDRHHAGARPRRAQRRRHDPRGRRRHRHPRSRTARVTGVETAAGASPARSSSSAPASGRAQLGRMAGVNVPLVSVQHQYIITEPIPGVPPGPADAARSRPPHLLQGGGRRPRHGRLRAEPDALGRGRHPRRLPLPAARRRLGPFRADHGAGARRACRRWRTPASSSSSTARRASRRTATSSSARRRRCENFFVGAGFNAFGIASGGGAGMALAEWVANGEPPYDLWPVDIRRFGRNHSRRGLGAHPHARGLRQALHDRLAVRGARLGPAAPPLAALRPPEGAGRRLRREARLGAAELVRRPRPASGRGRLLATAGRTGSRPSAASTAPCRERGRAVRPDLVRQVRADRAATRRRRSPGSAPTTSPSRRAPSPTRRC